MVGNIEDYKAPPTSWAKVDALADSLRSNLKMERETRIPIVNVVEKILYEQLELFEFQVRGRVEMGSAEGLTCPKGDFIRFREDVYESACDGGVRARFTFAHELGHFFMHTNVPLARALPSERLPAYRSAETQANRFAGTLLIPAALLTSQHTVEQIMSEFGVSKPAAEFRLSGLRKDGVL